MPSTDSGGLDASVAFADMYERAMKVLTLDEIVTRFTEQLTEAFAKAEEFDAPPPDVLWSIEVESWGKGSEGHYKHDRNEMLADRELWILAQRQFRLIHEHNVHPE